MTKYKQLLFMFTQRHRNDHITSYFDLYDRYTVNVTKTMTITIHRISRI